MSLQRVAVFLLCTLSLLGPVTSPALLAPEPALAADGALQYDASLQESPLDDAVSLGILPAGTQVEVTGDLVDGYYPVKTNAGAGWIRAEAFIVIEHAPPAASAAVATPIAEVVETVEPPAYVPEPAQPLEPNAPSVAVPDPGPVGPAEVTSEAPILAGPGPDYGILGTASGGALVEQTGHAVSGYVTVRYVGVTGWVSLANLRPPAAPANG